MQAVFHAEKALRLAEVDKSQCLVHFIGAELHHAADAEQLLVNFVGVDGGGCDDDSIAELNFEQFCHLLAEQNLAVFAGQVGALVDCFGDAGNLKLLTVVDTIDQPAGRVVG